MRDPLGKIHSDPQFEALMKSLRFSFMRNTKKSKQRLCIFSSVSFSIDKI